MSGNPNADEGRRQVRRCSVCNEWMLRGGGIHRCPGYQFVLMKNSGTDNARKNDNIHENGYITGRSPDTSSEMDSTGEGPNVELSQSEWLSTCARRQLECMSSGYRRPLGKLLMLMKQSQLGTFPGLVPKALDGREQGADCRLHTQTLGCLSAGGSCFLSRCHSFKGLSLSRLASGRGIDALFIP